MRGLVPNAWGWIPDGFTVSGSFAINGANVRMAFGFVPLSDRTISKVLIRVTATSGTLGANDFVVDLYSDTTTGANIGKPNALIESRDTVTAVPSGAGWIEVTGFTGTAALTGGTRYWLVVRNANGTPATNTFTLLQMRNIYDGIVTGLSTTSIAYATSTDAGSTWSLTAGGGCFRIEYSDATFDGFPLEGGITSTASTEVVYDTRELGGTFLTPANGKLNVAGALMVIGKTGTPTFTMEARIRLASDNSLIATSELEYVEKYAATRAIGAFWFSPTVTLDADTLYTITVGVVGSSGGSSSNYATSNYYTIENSAASKALTPCRGSVKQVYYNGSAWATTDTKVFPLKVLLDQQEALDEMSGGSGAILSRIQTGM